MWCHIILILECLEVKLFSVSLLCIFVCLFVTDVHFHHAYVINFLKKKSQFKVTLQSLNFVRKVCNIRHHSIPRKAIACLSKTVENSEAARRVLWCKCVLPDVQLRAALEGSFVYWTHRQLKTYDYCACVGRYCNWLAVLTDVEFLVFFTGKAVLCEESWGKYWCIS